MSDPQQHAEPALAEELGPRLARVVRQTQRPGRATILTAERWRAGPMESCQCSSEPGLSFGGSATRLVDPFEHEARWRTVVAVRGDEHLGDGQHRRFTQPPKAVRLGREEASRRIAVRLREHRPGVGELHPVRLRHITATEAMRHPHLGVEIVRDGGDEGEHRSKCGKPPRQSLCDPTVPATL